jgi:hypothetical protein
LFKNRIILKKIIKKLIWVTIRSGPVHGSARDGSIRSVFGWREDRPTVKPDRGKTWDVHGFDHGSVHGHESVRMVHFKTLQITFWWYSCRTHGEERSPCIHQLRIEKGQQNWVNRGKTTKIQVITCDHA